MTAAGLDYARRARTYVGVHEKRKGNVWTNLQKFGKRFGWNGQPWCQIFAWCVADDLGAGDLVPRTASCWWAAEWFRQRGQWSNKPEIGSLIYFGTRARVDHVGIVVEVTPKNVTYVSGNANDGTAPAGTGNAVTVATVPRSDPKIYGYGHPEWPKPAKTDDEGDPPTAPITPQKPSAPPASPSSSTPGPSSKPKPKPKPKKKKRVRSWVVRKGDTLTRIAAATGVTLSMLVAANPTLLHPGTKLVVPQVQPKTAGASPRPTAPGTATPRPPRCAPGEKPKKTGCKPRPSPAVTR